MSLWRVTLVTLLCACALSAFARESDQWAQSEFLPGRLLIEFAPSAQIRVSNVDDATLVTGSETLDAVFREVAVTSAHRWVPDQTLARLKVAPDIARVYVVEYASPYPVLQAIDRFAADPSVRRVEPDLLCRTFRTPNDGMWNSQWDKRIVQANSVWDVAVGTRDIICAGIDTGVDWVHPDLTPNLWVNPGEDLNQDSVAWLSSSYPGDLNDVDGVDSDSNGYEDDLLGWDFLTGVHNCATDEDCDNNQDNNMHGVNSHGTHVAGLMVARGNNSIGVAGMSWYGRLMALRAGYEDNQGNGYIPESSSGPAILYAVANGAKILNMSYGGSGSNTWMEGILNSAWDDGVLLFAASGNEGTSTPQYPANYDNVIAVNATDNSDHLAYWSNRGSWTDICAPGASPGITSTVVNGYGIMEGTSMASPNAAGVAALVWSVFPNMTNAEIRDLLFNTADNIAAQNPGIQLGHGRINARNAVAEYYPQMRVTASLISDADGGDGDGRLEAGESARLLLTCTNVTGWAAGQDITAEITTGDPNLSVSNGAWTLGDMPSGSSVNNSASPAVVTASASLDTAYWQDIRITFRSPMGYEETQPITIRVGRGRVLIVDDDGPSDFEQYFEDAVHGAHVSHDLWTVTSGALDGAEMNRYSVVLWSCGNQQTSTLTADDQTRLAAYLDAGGSAMVIGQNIDEDLRATPFYANYLHAQSEQLAGERELTGVSGNIISSGMSLLLQGNSCAGNGLTSPSRIVPTNGGEALFNYTHGGIGAVTYAGAYKVAYFAFALEAACGLGGTTHLNSVVASTLNWLGVIESAPAPRAATPSSIALRGNYPNPFNPTTTVLFDLSSPVHVTLKVYDLLGRDVATLVDQIVSAGSHSAVFDGSRLSSGVYLVRLQAGAVSASSKMVLMK